MTKTQKLLTLWYGHRFQTSCGTTPEFAKFAREFKAAIREQLGPSYELVAFNRGHFCCSGFARRGEKFIYFSISDVRFFGTSWVDRILIRTAKHETDYTGGRNQQTNLENFGRVADQIFTGAAFMALA